MKRKLFTFIVVVSLFILGGCYELDTTPYDQISASTFWETEEHAKQAIMGVYELMKNQYTFGTINLTDNLSDIGIGYDGQAYEAAGNGSYTDRTAFVVNHWRSSFDGVQRANAVIKNVGAMDIAEGKKLPVLAEAHFMRALYYFHLLDYFGGVPLYDETIDLNTDFNKMLKPRSSAEEVRKFILDDLSLAIKDLPVVWTAAEYGRATKGAAYALRGKVYLYNKEWDNAIADFEEIVNNKSNNYGFGLHTKYDELFNLKGHTSKEMIFAIQNKGGVGFSYGMPLAFYLGTRSTFGGCWNNGMPSTPLADMYENRDGKPFNWNDVIPGFNENNTLKSNAFTATHTSGVLKTIPDTALLGQVYRNRDPRMMQSIIVPYSYYLGWNANKPRLMQFVVATGVNENFGQIRNNKGWTTYFWRKFVPEANLDGQISDRAHTPFNFPLIRYADVLLMLSEAYNEKGSLDKAVTELNKVRERSGMPGLNTAPWLTVTNKGQMFERIMHERAVELAGEGHRFSDLRRWGKAKEILSGKIEKGLTGANLFTRKFEDRDYLWPIPAQEIEVNPELTPNPGWF